MRHERCELIMMALMKRLGADEKPVEISEAEIDEMRKWHSDIWHSAPSEPEAWRVTLKMEFFDV